MQVNPKEVGNALKDNKAFIDFMRILCEVSGYKTYVMEGNEKMLERYNGKRQVYIDIMAQLDLDVETRFKIENKEVK